MSEEGSEIEVVGKDDQAVLFRVGEDGGVSRRRRAHVSSVDGVNAGIAQPVNPARSKVHVEEELHDAVSGSSCSSARQAA